MRATRSTRRSGTAYLAARDPVSKLMEPTPRSAFRRAAATPLLGGARMCPSGRPGHGRAAACVQDGEHRNPRVPLMAALLHQKTSGSASATAAQAGYWSRWVAQRRRPRRRRSHSCSGAPQPKVWACSSLARTSTSRAAYKLFDPEDKGHITAVDLYRVCHQLGFGSERDAEHASAARAFCRLGLDEPPPPDVSKSGGPVERVGGEGPGGGDEPAEAAAHPATAARDLVRQVRQNDESSYRRCRVGEAIFRQATLSMALYRNGECGGSSARSPHEIASSPWRLLCETGCSRGEARATPTSCKTPVEVLMIATCSTN